MNLKRLEYVLFALTLFLLPTQLGRHFWPNFSYLYSLPVDYFAPTLYLWDILVGALFLTSIINSFLGSKNLNYLSFIKSKAPLVVIFFLLTQLVSLVPFVHSTPVNIGVGLVRIQQYLVSIFFAVYIASCSVGFLKKNLFWPLACGLLFQSIIGIVEFFQGGSLGLWIFGERTFSLSTPAIAKFDFYGQQFLRPYATFSHPNVLAGFITIIMPVLVLLAVTKSQKYFLLTNCLSIVTLLLTVSRVAITAGLIEVGFFIDEKKLQIIRQTKVLIPLIIVVLLITPFLYTRFMSTFTFDQISLFRREDLTSAAVEIFKQSPIFGVGLNNFILAISQQVIAGPNRFLQPVHNIFLLAISETGLIGLCGLLLLIFFPIKRLVHNMHNYNAQVLLLIWMMIIFLGFFDHYLLTLPQGYRLLFFIWGLSIVFTEDLSFR